MRYRILYAVLALILILTLIGAIYFFMMFRVDYTAINEIKGQQKSPGVFMDASDDIGVKSVEDIRYVVTGELKMDLHYGKKVIIITRRCFESPDYMAALKEIGIEIRHKEMNDGTYKYKVTYWGEDVQEYAQIG